MAALRIALTMALAVTLTMTAAATVAATALTPNLTAWLLRLRLLLTLTIVTLDGALSMYGITIQLVGCIGKLVVCLIDSDVANEA